VLRRRMLGVRCGDRLVAGQRLGHAAERVQHDAAVVRRIHVPRVEIERAIEAHQRLVVACVRVQLVAHAYPEGGVARILAERFLELGERGHLPRQWSRNRAATSRGASLISEWPASSAAKRAFGIAPATAWPALNGVIASRRPATTSVGRSSARTASMSAAYSRQATRQASRTP